MNSKFPMIIAYDMVLKKPGCALLQAAYGATIGNFDLHLFEVENWLLAPTENIKCYTLKSKEELNQAIQITHQTHGKANSK